MAFCFIQHHIGTQWENIVWYTVTPPSMSSRKQVVVCHNCREKISIHSELRVTTPAIMKGEARGSYLPITMSFHAKPDCLLNWQYYEKLGSVRQTIVAFNKKVALSPEFKLEDHYQRQLDELTQGGIVVVPQSPFLYYDQIPGTTVFSIIC